MELIRGLHNIKPKHHGCVLTIGKFDGVHLGHQAVLKNVIDKALALGLPSVVMVFEPQPEEFFAPEHAPARLSLLRDKYSGLAALGINRLICVRFDASFSSMSPQDFIKQLLVDKLGVKFLVVGDDFRFGAGRKGNFEMLQAHGQQIHFDVVSTQSFRMEDCRISSTEIRQALSTGNFAKANAMLGQAYHLEGRVVHGEKNGRKIGFPTANILLKRHKSPLSGVFAVRVTYRDKSYKAVANVGHRPTLNGQRMQLEVHLFDFDSDLYGKTIYVEFVAKIRDEIKFSDFNELAKQIKIDANQAKVLMG